MKNETEGRNNNYPRYRKNKTNLLSRTSKVVNDLKGMFPELALTGEKLIPLLARCRRKYEKNLFYGRQNVPENRRRQRRLTATEQVIYNWLIQEGYNPSTLYRNFLAVWRVPSDLKNQMKEGKISQTLALELAQNRKARVDFGNAQIFLDEFVEVCRGMRW